MTKQVSMEWLTDLLDRVAISRSVAGATFVTTLALYWGPRNFPDYIDPVPKEWGSAVVGAMVFSGALLFFWLVSAAWEILARGADVASKRLTTRQLEPREIEVILR